MKKLIVLIFSLLFLMPLTAMATPITADFTGERYIGSGVTGTNGTKGEDGWLSKGFSISWSITQTVGGYNYSYTLDPAGQGGVSNFILEVSTATTKENFKFSDDQAIEGPQYYSQAGNQNLPSVIYGIKFDFGGDPITYTFFSTQAPVWGDFFAKDGAFGAAWNKGFGSDLTFGPYTDWVATPDTFTTIVPEPCTFAFFGIGLIGIGIFGRRRMML